LALKQEKPPLEDFHLYSSPSPLKKPSGGLVQHRIGGLCLISFGTTVFDDFVQHGIKQVVQSHVGRHLSNEISIIGQIVWFFWISQQEAQ
jgi:hypothetical protein